MDAVKFLKEKERMCENILCDECPLSNRKNGTDYWCRSFIEKFPEKAITVVEKWSEEHPVKTRKSELLKMFPNAPVDENGVPIMMPCHVDCSAGKRCNSYTNCDACKKEYWAAEVE